MTILEQVVEVVSDAAGELSDGLHLLAFHEAALLNCFRSVILRAISEAPTILPAASRSGEMESETWMNLPVFVLRTVSRRFRSAHRHRRGRKKEVILLLEAVHGQEALDGLADHFLGGVSEDFFRACVPAGDDALHVLADDGVFA